MKERIAQAIEQGFEKFLWNSRFIVILAVVASMISSVILFVVATFDVFELIGKVFRYMTLSGSERTVAAYEEFHGDVVGHIIGAIDDYLLATVLFIFALGLYELFISKIDEAEAEAATSSRILLIHSLDDLKDRLAKVIPFVGALSGGALNYFSVRAVGRAAIKYYQSRVDPDIADEIWSEGDREHA